VPEFVVKAIFGEMGEALLLGSQRVSSAALQASGYCYLYRELKPALQALLS
jgi:NAD dependent epimerase/dehydratase family enzyme